VICEVSNSQTDVGLLRRRIAVSECNSLSVASPAMGHRGACPLDFQLIIFEGCTSDSHRFLQ